MQLQLRIIRCTRFLDTCQGILFTIRPVHIFQSQNLLKKLLTKIGFKSDRLLKVFVFLRGWTLKSDRHPKFQPRNGLLVLCEQLLLIVIKQD